MDKLRCEYLNIYVSMTPGFQHWSSVMLSLHPLLHPARALLLIVWCLEAHEIIANEIKWFQITETIRTLRSSLAPSR